VLTLKVQHGVRRVLLCLALIAPVVAQCSSSQPQPTTPDNTCSLPQNIQMVLRGGERLNPNDQGQALPVEVRVYQLKASAKMEESEFDAIWRTDHDTLGPDMVKVDVLYLYPGQRIRRAFRREDGVTHVVAVAIFRHPSGQSWRTIYELPPAPADAECAARRGEDGGVGGDPRYFFYLDEYYIEAMGDDPGEETDGGRLPGRLPGIPTAPQAPTVPTLPQTPTVPQVPSAPSLPSAPQAPSLPSAPSAPSAPSVPRLKGGIEGHA
jgi:type VI secretion system VasD/TssJ family lipoprotein